MFNRDKIEQGTKLILEGIGEDLTREGLVDTPKRVAKAYEFLCKGYEDDVPSIMSRTFSEDHNEMVLLKNVRIVSLCEHHLLPFRGIAHVAYIPDKKVLGLSKIARLVEAFARRLQLQERLTVQIATTIMKELKPLGAGVVIDCEHLCMTARGVQKEESTTITSCMRGVFLDPNKQAREEFLKLIK